MDVKKKPRTLVQIDAQWLLWANQVSPALALCYTTLSTLEVALLC